LARIPFEKVCSLEGRPTAGPTECRNVEMKVERKAKGKLKGKLTGKLKGQLTDSLKES